MAATLGGRITRESGSAGTVVEPACTVPRASIGTILSKPTIPHEPCRTPTTPASAQLTPATPHHPRARGHATLVACQSIVHGFSGTCDVLPAICWTNVGDSRQTTRGGGTLQDGQTDRHTQPRQSTKVNEYPAQQSNPQKLTSRVPGMLLCSRASARSSAIPHQQKPHQPPRNSPAHANHTN